MEMEYQGRLNSFFPNTRTGSPPLDFFSYDDFLSFDFNKAAQNNGEMYQRLPEEMSVLREAPHPHPPQVMEAEWPELEWPP